MNDLQILASLFGAALTAWVAGRLSLRTKREEVQSAPYKALSERVAELEARVRLLTIWAADVIPLHADLVARWDWWRQQPDPPRFPPFPDYD